MIADAAAIVGIGETDYPEDYCRARAGEVYEDAYGYAAHALRRALDDAGLTKDDIDGLVGGHMFALERCAEVLGIDPSWSTQAQLDGANAVTLATMAINAGLAECVALVYGNAGRTAGTAYGGPAAMGGDRYLAYVYHAPWGLTSQGGLYGLTASRYMQVSGLTASDLGEFVLAQRRWAQLNPGAIMRKPLTLDDYLGGRFIAEPLRLFDYCLINDGGVALIVTTPERARRSRTAPVVVAGIGRSELNDGATSLRPRLTEFYRPAQRLAAERVSSTSGLGPSDVDVIGIYDSFSLHVPMALEGFGYCPGGDPAHVLRRGGTGPGGALPINTSGGHLSGSYMQGWGHQVELVRQLRHEAGDRQVPGARVGQYIASSVGKVQTIHYRRGDL
jgi:acetyl-CoA acetyltransferase